MNVLLPVCLLLMFCRAGCNLHPDDQAKTSTALDTAEFFLKETQEIFDKQLKKTNDLLKTAEQQGAYNLLKKQLQLVKVASTLKFAVAFLQYASAIASFIFTFFMPSELEVVTTLINERFDEVNHKLLHLHRSLENMEDKLRSSIQYHTFITNYIDWESDVKNGAQKLTRTKEAIGVATDPRKKLKLAEEYIISYQGRDIEGKISNLHRIATQRDSDLTPNIFKRYITTYGCDIQELSGIMSSLTMLMTNAAYQTVTYYHFKGFPDEARKTFDKVQQYLTDMRRSFRLTVYHCMLTTVSNAQKDTDEIVSKSSSSSSEVSDLIYKKLSTRYPWYSWAVADTADVKARTTLASMERKGSNFFEFLQYMDNKKGIIVAWQEVIVNHTSCSDVHNVKTFVSFDGHHFISSDNLLSSQKCPRFADEVFEVEIQKAALLFCPEKDNLECRQLKSKQIQDEVNRWGWIAVPSIAVADPCLKSETCNGQGTCKSLPGTNRFMCICDDAYDGENCEVKLNSEDVAGKHLAALRHEFQIATGVPTVVDVFFEVRDLGTSTKAILDSMKDQLSHTQVLVNHSEILYQVSYIAGLYQALLSGNITVASFGKEMDSFLKDKSERYLLVRLKGILLAEGIADSKGKDFFNTFKGNYLSQNNNPCSEVYATAISVLLRSLASLDQAVVEALVMHKQWKLQNNMGMDSEGLEDFFQNYKGRQAQYQAYWKSTSCPKMQVADLSQNFCDEKLSYEGMKVDVSCSPSKRPSVSSIQCIRGTSGLLQWSATPRCDYYWLPWTSWSPCSVTCGSGTRYRTRECTGPDISNCNDISQYWLSTGNTNLFSRQTSNSETETCSRETCCQEKLGRYECSDGTCISRSSLCDGNYDCPSKEDESETHCPDYIRSGKTIALKSKCFDSQTWLSCGTGGDWCWRGTCPGEWMDASDWGNCGSETFTIYAPGKQDGEHISYGDQVALRSSGKYWLSCWGRGTHCKSRDCPGYHGDMSNCRGEQFWIFAQNRRGSCDYDTVKNCIGAPIQKNDHVFLLYTPDDDKGGYWLSHNEHKIDTRTCPGRYLVYCRCEAWHIFQN